MARDPSSPCSSAGDSRVLDDRWVGEHYERIHRAAWYMTGDAWEAEDLAQETFVVAIDCWTRFAGDSSEATWLYGILIRLHQRRRRSFVRMKRRLAVYLDRSEGSRSQSEDPQWKLAQDQWRESVWADVSTLPANQRVAVVLRFAEGMSYQQIADVLGCAVGTAKTRVHHGLKHLRCKLDSSAIPDEREGVNYRPSDFQPAIHMNARW